MSGGCQNLRIPEWRAILNIYIAQSGKAWDLAALAPPEMPRKAGVHMKPHRRPELVTQHPSSYQTEKFLEAVTQCSWNPGLCPGILHLDDGRTPLVSERRQNTDLSHNRTIVGRQSGRTFSQYPNSDRFVEMLSSTGGR